ncbi:MAG: AmmeMemoRadiSam system radical SAM enzyme [Victivallales bacterium]|nr:AmmeMemoRadiSam system radical SAM enzyme [Victivallales bacterium]
MMDAPVARWWEAAEGDSVICRLCPRQCRIANGQTGYCGVRINEGGTLRTLAYGRPISVAIDPIEKKPLARFLPKSKVFSLGAYGCNLGCLFCQNDSLSRGCYSDEEAPLYVPPERIVELARRHGCPSIAYTYNEPTVFAEYACDIAREAHQAGLKNVLVSNGFISPEAANDLYPLMDAANIDMKGFSEAFYQKMCGGNLAPVLESLETLKRLNVHLEVTTLVIPGQNDDLAEISAWLDWVESYLDLATPLHFSAYHPAYRCHLPPTPVSTLLAIRDLALQRGFTNVFLGNVGL